MTITKAQKKAVQKSFAQVAPQTGALTRLFYRRLFQVAPGVRALFPDDLSEQRKKLATTLGVAVKGLDDLDKLVPVLKNLGAKHIDYGAEPAHYDVVGEVLLFSLSQTLAWDWSDDVKEAWGAVYGVVASTMIAGADEAMQQAA